MYDYPLFDFVLGDIDSLFLINQLMNADDILSEFDLKATSATNTIAKINQLSKLVSGGGVTLKDLFKAKSLTDNIGERGTLRVIQTMSSFDTLNEISRHVEFKAALRQIFQRLNSKDVKRYTSYHTCKNDSPELIVDTGAQRSCKGG